jgi:hypothetical protein
LLLLRNFLGCVLRDSGREMCRIGLCQIALGRRRLGGKGMEMPERQRKLDNTSLRKV